MGYNKIITLVIISLLCAGSAWGQTNKRPKSGLFDNIPFLNGFRGQRKSRLNTVKFPARPNGGRADKNRSSSTLKTRRRPNVGQPLSKNRSNVPKAPARLNSGQLPTTVRTGPPKELHLSGAKSKKVCPIFQKTGYPYQGIGFKLGDPFALTYKLYLRKNWAAAADVGMAASALYSKYYREGFVNYVPELAPLEVVSYVAHRVPTDLCIQVKFLRQWGMDVLFKGLQVYAGLGWQWRITDLRYEYSYNENNPLLGGGRIIPFDISRFTYGGIAIVGLEYSYFSLPISAFIETELFVDTFADPGYRNFQGGIGIRYILPIY